MAMVSMYGMSVTPANPGYLIWRLSMKWRAELDRALAPLGLTHAQYSVLASLYGAAHSGALPSQRELADITGLDPIYVSKLIRVLEQRGLAARATNVRDPRARQLSLTPQGIETVTEAMALVHSLQGRLTRSIGGLRGQAVKDLVNTLRQLLDDNIEGDSS
jgi:DNA-binding MarR family transcriptional regulator